MTNPTPMQSVYMRLIWRKSTKSSGSTGQCVEVALRRKMTSKGR